MHYNNYLKVLGTYLGIDWPLTSHTARHTFATLQLVHVNTNPVVTMNLLGHRKLDTTGIYAHEVVDKHVAAIRGLDALIMDDV